MANCGRCLRCLPDELNGNGQYLLLRPREQLRSTAMSTSVCLSVFPLREYLRNHTRDLYHFCACCLWPWLGPSPASLRAAIRYVLPVLWITSFLGKRQLRYVRYMRSQFRLSSVCLWRWCTLLSRLKFSAIFLRYTIAQGLNTFLMPKFVGGDAPFPLKFAFKVTHPISNSEISTNIGS